MSSQQGHHASLFNNPHNASCILRIIDTSRRPIASAFSVPGIADQYYWIHEWVVVDASAVLKEAFEWRTNYTKRECPHCENGHGGCHARRHHRPDGMSETESAWHTKHPHDTSRTYFPMQTAKNGILYQWHGIQAGKNASDPPIITEYPHDINCAREWASQKSRKNEPSAEPNSARVMSIATLTSPTPTPISTPAPSSTRATRASSFRAPRKASSTRTARRSSLSEPIVETPEPAPIMHSCVPLLTICLPHIAAFPETLYWMYSHDDGRLRRALRRMEGITAAVRDEIGTKRESRSLMEMFYYLAIEDEMGKESVDSRIPDWGESHPQRHIMDVNGLERSLVSHWPRCTLP